jgi:purine-nucleoside phosphorylase
MTQDRPTAASSEADLAASPGGAGPGTPPDPYAAARQSAARLAEETGQQRHDAAVILGSGWAPAADAAAAALGAAVIEVPVARLSGFAAGSVAGHQGTVRSLTTPNLRLLVFLGRVHLYEGLPVSAVVHPVRTAAAAGCRAVVLTNAAGGIREGYRVGQPVLIRDHLNLTGASPLTGPPPPEPYPSRFTDLTALYSPRLRGLAREADPGLADGVYAGLRGPHYETPAEIAMLRLLGADLVGMSTVLEAIAARHLGLDVLGISLVTNLAAGLSAQALDHGEVVAAGAAATDRLGALLARILPGVVSR